MTIEKLRENGSIVFECISGSRAYGLDLPHSDTDIKGVYILPESVYFGLEYYPQISNESNDIVFYELKRFIELLYKNNPNLLEMLSVPDECIVYKNPLFDEVKESIFLSKKCKETFGGYALTQIRKARGLKKKVLNPVDKEKKTILDFCSIVNNSDSIPVHTWLQQMQYKQEQCGLVNIPHMKEVYSIFYDNDNTLGFRGIISKPNSSEVCLSSIPKEMESTAIMSFNKDAYSRYCRDYREYWEWVEKRNDERYQNTLQHGKNYDSKNMMHTFRLLDMAEEIAIQKKVIVRRPNREHLLKIRAGEFSYDELVQQAEEKMMKLEELYKSSDLPDEVNYNKVNNLLMRLRQEFYRGNTTST